MRIDIKVVQGWLAHGMDRLTYGCGRTVMMLNVGGVMFGFRVDSITDVPDVDGRLWRMTYQKNGAELMWLERKDDVKTFSIAFKTQPEDDTGVAHILEHSVLAGSEKYPVKSPFCELRKSSLRVFMNAMTYSDKTCYPFSTRSDQDFLNLADVYLDAVFHPTAMKSPMAFGQEGWHYEIDQKTGALSYNGVVYNEMKGVSAEPEQLAGREVMRHLYPDTVYGNDSGGKPSAIPHLTYEKFCAFYRRHYHPSNALIFLDGGIDLPTVLAKLDSCLSEFDRAEKVAPIPLQKPVRCAETIPYPSADCRRKTILADAWSVGTYGDLVSQAALDVLVDYLAGSNEAPLKKALLSSGLCDDVRMYWYDYRQMPLVLIVRNTSDEQAAQCRAVVRETIAGLLKNGLDRTRIRAIINRNEFNEREAGGSYPRGLEFFLRSVGQWMYGGEPAAAFDISGIFAKLRQGVETGLFERCLRDAVIGNPHHIELTLTPSPDCGAEETKRTADELAERLAGMSPDDIAKLKREAAELATYQQREDTEEAKAKVPSLRLSDIPKNGRIVEHSISTNGSMTVVTTKPTSDGIAYVSVFFPADGLGVDELPMLPLLARLFGQLPTARYDALALQTEVAARFGRLSFRATTTERGNYLVAQFAVLTDRAEEAMELLAEILRRTKFEDEVAVSKVLKQVCLSSEREVAARGFGLAELYSARTYSRSCASSDLVHGYSQLRWLQGAKADGALVRRLGSLASRIIVRDGMVLSMTDNLSKDAKAALFGLADPSDGRMTVPAPLALEPGTLVGVRIDGDAGYSGTVAKLPPDMPYEGAMRVAAKILSFGFLHRQIREVGGAYGTALSIRPNGMISCFTYRDPTPVKSVQAVRSVGDELMDFVNSGEALDRYVVATIAEMDPYRSPADEATRPVGLFLAKRTFEEVEGERRQVLATTRQDLTRVAEMLRDRLKESRSMVVGGEVQVSGLPAATVEPLRLR